MKKLMVLGASAPQVQLIKAAKGLGYRTVVCSIPGDYPGFAAADETSFADISDPEAVLAAARQFAVDGIATCCLDTGVRALGYACERLGLPGLSEAAAICSADKWSMKTAFMKAGVNTARFRRVTDEASLASALEELALPVILKAVDLQGSRGIYICRTREEAFANVSRTLAETKKDFCIVEEFIEGNELGAQSFVYKGQVLFVLPHGDNTYLSGTNVPIGHYAPLDAPAAVLAAAEEQVRRAIAAIGLDNCAVNLDLIEKDGKVYVIELTGRAGATCLPETVSIYYGLNYYEMIAAMAVGDDPVAIFNARTDARTPNASRMLLSERAGTVRRITDGVTRDESIYDLSVIVKPGDRVEKFTNAKHRLGQVIVQGPSVQWCFDRIDQIGRQFVIEIE